MPRLRAALSPDLPIGEKIDAAQLPEGHLLKVEMVLVPRELVVLPLVQLVVFGKELSKKLIMNRGCLQVSQRCCGLRSGGWGGR
jgi:hypothetical protein